MKFSEGKGYKNLFDPQGKLTPLEFKFEITKASMIWKWNVYF